MSRVRCAMSSLSWTWGEDLAGASSGDEVLSVEAKTALRAGSVGV